MNCRVTTVAGGSSSRWLERVIHMKEIQSLCR